MKFLKFILFSAAMLILASCSSDDDGGPSPVELTTANLAATYEINFYEGSYQLTTTASNGSVVVVESETYVGDTFTNARFVFNTDGTYVLSGSYRETTTSTVNGETTTDADIITLDETGTFAVNATNRTLTLDSDVVFDVVVFDETRLTLQTEDVDIDNGFTETEEFEIRATRI